MTYKEKLLVKYPMLASMVPVESEYIGPQRYKRLLKEYVFGGHTDLQIFYKFLKTSCGVAKKQHGQIYKVLELGVGTGRATKILLKSFHPSHIHLLDLSKRMLKKAQKQLGVKKNITFIRSDTINYLEKSNKQYDLIFSLWGFSYSIHQLLRVDKLREYNKKRIKIVIKRMVEKMMHKGSQFFIIHVDSQSDEQRIVFKQWAKSYAIFNRGVKQTPSKLLLDEIFKELQQDGIIEFYVRHLEGDLIIYTSLKEAMDVFLNFHLKSHFNQSLQAKKVADEIKKYILKFKQSDGSFAIKPGCFIYEIKKIK